MRSVVIMIGILLFAHQVRAESMPREKVPVAERWDLTHLYPDDQAWREGKDQVIVHIDKLQRLEKGFGRSAVAMQRAMEEISSVDKEVARLYSYAHMKSDQDTRSASDLALKQEMEVVLTRFSTASAWTKPAILKLGRKRIDSYLKNNRGLTPFAQVLDNTLRMAPHTLNGAEEKILADSGLIADSAYNIYSILSNADLPFPKIKLSSGEQVTLNQAAYTHHRAAAQRDDRKKVFQTFWKTYRSYGRTFGVALDANVKRDIFYARSRSYSSALESALDRNNVPVTVYSNLIADVHRHLPSLHRYLKLRARMLGIKKLAYHDLYPPLVKQVALKYSYAEGKDLVLSALAPLGSEYTTALRKGLDARWIDVHPTPGKKSGAYSSGSAYDVHPYILLNYNGGYDDVSTLAHEIGHTMHSWFSNKHQPYATSDYPIFLAEIASTTNEALLIRHMLKLEKDPSTRLFLLGSYLESMRTTIFRQAMFAEYEKVIHETSERGEALTGERLSQLYGGLLRLYHGHDEGICDIDELYTYEWAYIPHFYYNFYVFQYATGMVAATALTDRVLSGGEPALEAYLGFLQAGSSSYPIDIMKRAGVDLTTSAPFDATMKVMNEVMDEIETILKQRASKGS